MRSVLVYDRMELQNPPHENVTASVSLGQTSRPCELPSTESSKSFWHREPSEILKGHRTTHDLPKSADVVIIGSGITGASVAHHLITECQSRLTVIMLESREACWGATGRNGGHCQPILMHHTREPSIGHFELRNLDTIRTMIKNKKIECEFVTQPGVRAIYDEKMLLETEAKMREVRQLSPELAEMTRLVTDRKALRGYRVPTALGAIVTDIAARLWPYKFVARILEDLLLPSESQGSFNLQTMTSAESIDWHNPSAVEVRTARGTITAKKVILATNAYTSHLLPEFADLITPCRGQMSALVPVPSIAGDNRLKTSMGLEGSAMDDYLIQRPSDDGGELMFGGGRQEGPSLGLTDDSVVDEAVASYLRRRLIEAMQLPEGQNGALPEGLKASYMWTGVMGFSRDDHPWVGPVPGRPNVYMSAGYTGHGMPNAWLCGRAIALAVANSFQGASNDAAMKVAGSAVGLPESYRLTEERISKARALETVEKKDWAEMQYGQKI